MVGRQVSLSFWENRPIFRGVFWLLVWGSVSRKCSNFRRWDFYSKQVFHGGSRGSSHVCQGQLKSHLGASLEGTLPSHTSGLPFDGSILNIYHLGVAKALQLWVHNLQYIHIYEGNPNSLDYPLFAQVLRYHHEPTFFWGVNRCRPAGKILRELLFWPRGVFSLNEGPEWQAVGLPGHLQHCHPEESI